MFMNNSSHISSTVILSIFSTNSLFSKLFWYLQPSLFGIGSIPFCTSPNCVQQCTVFQIILTRYSKYRKGYPNDLNIISEPSIFRSIQFFRLNLIHGNCYDHENKIKHHTQKLGCQVCHAFRHIFRFEFLLICHRRDTLMSRAASALDASKLNVSCALFNFTLIKKYLSSCKDPNNK